MYIAIYSRARSLIFWSDLSSVRKQWRLGNTVDDGLAWAFTGRLGDNYHNLAKWFILKKMIAPIHLGKVKYL